MIKLCLTVQPESCELLARSDEYSLSAIAAEVVPSGGGTFEVSWHEWDNVIVPDGGLNAFDFTSSESGENCQIIRLKGCLYTVRARYRQGIIMNSLHY